MWAPALLRIELPSDLTAPHLAKTRTYHIP